MRIWHRTMRPNDPAKGWLAHLGSFRTDDALRERGKERLHLQSVPDAAAGTAIESDAGRPGPTKRATSIFKCYYIVSLLDNSPNGPSNIGVTQWNGEGWRARWFGFRSEGRNSNGVKSRRNPRR